MNQPNTSPAPPFGPNVTRMSGFAGECCFSTASGPDLISATMFLTMIGICASAWTESFVSATSFTSPMAKMLGKRGSASWRVEATLIWCWSLRSDGARVFMSDELGVQP